MAMNVFEFVLLILIICFCYKAFETYIRSRPSKKEKLDEEQAEDRFRSLEERIKVLERIVTDDRYDLKKEFKDLER